MTTYDTVRFGDRVKVHGKVEVWYVTAHHERQHRSHPGVFTVTKHDGPLQHRWNPKGDKSDTRDTPPGIPVEPAPTMTPERGTHRHLRRVPCDVAGVVVGRTWRTEGRYTAGHSSITWDEYDDDYEPPYLTEHRRVPVVQVAVDRGDVGGRHYAANVIDVYPDDLTPEGHV